MTLQMSLFHPQFDGRIRSIEIDGKTYFSVLDVFQYYGSKGSAANPHKYWTRIQKTLKKQSGSDTLPGVVVYQFLGSDGRLKAATPVATFKAFLRIAETSEIEEWEPLRQWMAEVAHERIEEQANPALGVERAQKRAIDVYQSRGKDAKWIATRIKGIDERKAFTDSLVKAVVDLMPNQHIPQATNIVYRGVLGRDANTLKADMNLKPKDSLRDNLSSIALHYTGIVEEMVSHSLAKLETVEWKDAKRIIEEVSKIIGVQAEQVAGYMGIDLATGNQLIAGDK